MPNQSNLQWMLVFIDISYYQSGFLSGESKQKLCGFQQMSIFSLQQANKRAALAGDMSCSEYS